MSPQSTTKKIAKPKQRITVTTRTLHQLLKPVSPCVETTGMLPVLNTIHVELRGEYLVAKATDRYRLGICRQPLALDEDGDPAPAPTGVEFKALIDFPDVQHLLKLFPVGRHGEGAVSLTIDGDKLIAEAVGGLIASELRVVYTLNTQEYPDLESVAYKQLTAEGDPQPVTTVAPDYIASFKAAVLDRHQVLEILAPKEKNKPLVCKVGDHFLGLIMPRSKAVLSGGDDSAPAWETFLRPDKAEVAA